MVVFGAVVLRLCYRCPSLHWHIIITDSCLRLHPRSMLRMLRAISKLAVTNCVLASRLQPQDHLAQSSNHSEVKAVYNDDKLDGENSAEHLQDLQDSVSSKTSACPQGMHIRLNKALTTDKHVADPDANDPEEYHFVLAKGLEVGESERGKCHDLVRGPPLIDSNDELWNVDDSEALGFLYGFIEVACRVDAQGKKVLEVEFACRKLVPFSTRWEQVRYRENFMKRWGPELQALRAEEGRSGNPKPEYEFAEFTCANPLQRGSNLLQQREPKVLRIMTRLSTAKAACEADSQCEAIAIEQIHPGQKEQKFHLLDSFNCMPVKESFNSTFQRHEVVRLRYLAHDERLWREKGFSRRTGTVLKSWSLEDAEAAVLVEFTYGAQYVLAEHLAKENEDTLASSWPVLRKIREMKTVSGLAKVTNLDSLFRIGLACTLEIKFLTGIEKPPRYVMTSWRNPAVTSKASYRLMSSMQGTLPSAIWRVSSTNVPSTHAVSSPTMFVL